MKLATWNVNSLTIRLPQVLAWLAANPDVDVLALQELKMVGEKFPHAEFEAAGFQSFALGQKTYNGVALIVKNGLTVTDVVRNNPHFPDEQARLIAACVNGIQVVGGYFPNGQAPDSDKFIYKMAWLTALHTWTKEQMTANDKLVIMGDYNVAPEDRDSYDPEGLRETIHHTSAERGHFNDLIALGMVDAFRAFEQAPKSYSWWDYRDLAFRRNRGLRIDHILVSHTLKDKIASCTIDKAPRKNERPSDHTPVVMELTV